MTPDTATLAWQALGEVLRDVVIGTLLLILLVVLARVWDEERAETEPAAKHPDVVFDPPVSAGGGGDGAPLGNRLRDPRPENAARQGQRATAAAAQAGGLGMRATALAVNGRPRGGALHG